LNLEPKFCPKAESIRKTLQLKLKFTPNFEPKTCPKAEAVLGKLNNFNLHPTLNQKQSKS